MTRGMIYTNTEEVKQSLLPGYAVVVVRQDDGSLKIYDEPKNTNYSHEHHLLECNLAGATVLYEEKAILVP